MVSKASLESSIESASNHDTTLPLTDFAAISAVVGPCFSFLPTFYRIDPAVPAVPMLVSKYIKDRSIMVVKASLESASNHDTTLQLTDFAAISAVVGPCFSFLPTF